MKNASVYDGVSTWHHKSPPIGSWPPLRSTTPTSPSLVTLGRPGTRIESRWYGLGTLDPVHRCRDSESEEWGSREVECPLLIGTLWRESLHGGCFVGPRNYHYYFPTSLHHPGCHLPTSVESVFLDPSSRSSGGQTDPGESAHWNEEVRRARSRPFYLCYYGRSVSPTLLSDLPTVLSGVVPL